MHMEAALQTLRLQGRIPMASALVGTDTRPPLWVTSHLRVTAGTSIDLTLRPHPLTQKKIYCSYRCGEGTGMFQRDALSAPGSGVPTRSLDQIMTKAHIN